MRNGFEGHGRPVVEQCSLIAVFMCPPAHIHVSGPSNTKQDNLSGSRENVCLYACITKGSQLGKGEGERGWLAG